MRKIKKDKERKSRKFERMASGMGKWGEVSPTFDKYG